MSRSAGAYPASETGDDHASWERPLPTSEVVPAGRQNGKDHRPRAHWAGAAATVFVHSGVGLGGAGGLPAGGRRAADDSREQEVRGLKVRMVCVKAPRFLSGILRLVTGKKKKA